jgi:7-cyano-7-deazaguanine synthase in queuosine biosynthesis
MREAFVICGGETASARGKKQVLHLDVSPDAPLETRIKFDPASITTRLADDLPDTLADAVEIAAYVYCADRLVRRATGNDAHIGDEWQRKLQFRIPVRCADLWSGREVREALVNALTFLSGDRFTFEFIQSRNSVSVEPFLGFNDHGAQIVRPERVMLFSGGLDSLAGASEHIVGGGRSAVLVAHKSASQIACRQDQIAEQIKARATANNVFYAPIWVGRGRAEPKEHSQRLRSFLFATLGMAYAYMFGQRSVFFYENGITSFNLPMGEQVLGTRASRTTHPRVLGKFGRLFSLVLDEGVTFENPFLWDTKADIVERIATNGCADLIPMSVSCANSRKYSMTGQQCGCCSQCVERRYAALAAGVEEPAGTYIVDLFTGAHEDARGLTMAERHILRAKKLSGMTEHVFLANYGHVFRALGGLGCSPEEGARRIFQLHRRYGEKIVEIFDAELRKHSSLDELLSLPPTSLVSMIRAPLARQDGFENRRVDDSVGRPKPERPLRHRGRTTFAIDGQRVLFGDGPTVSGKGSQLFRRLAEQYRSDLQGGKEPAAYLYVSTKRLTDEFNISEEALRQQVHRLRTDLERKFEADTGYTLDREDIVQSTNWTGYRLNPFLIEVDARQLFPPRKMSRKSVSGVTTLDPDPENRPSA